MTWRYTEPETSVFYESKAVRADELDSILAYFAITMDGWSKVSEKDGVVYFRRPMRVY